MYKYIDMIFYAAFKKILGFRIVINFINIFSRSSAGKSFMCL